MKQGAYSADLELKMNLLLICSGLRVLLELDPFLNELTKLYEQSKTSGTRWVTLKRCTYTLPLNCPFSENAECHSLT